MCATTTNVHDVFQTSIDVIWYESDRGDATCFEKRSRVAYRDVKLQLEDFEVISESHRLAGCLDDHGNLIPSKVSSARLKLFKRVSQLIVSNSSWSQVCRLSRRSFGDALQSEIWSSVYVIDTTSVFSEDVTSWSCLMYYWRLYVLLLLYEDNDSRRSLRDI